MSIPVIHPVARSYSRIAAARLIDLMGALCVLTVIAPAMILIAVLIKLDGGPILIWEDSRQCPAHPNRIWKFRTPRRSAFGRFLRTYSLDELPRLFNVIAGKASLAQSET